ncbi:MAG: adenylate kinase [Chitinophagales bacterium]
MINVVLFGPPGSGKGTQAVKMLEKYGFLHISTGDLFRNAIKNETEMGLKAKAFMDKGNLVPDEVTIGMMNAVINDNPDVKGIIFDGFPRTVAQAEALDVFLNSKNTPVSKMIALEVSEEELIKRLLNRGKDSGRADDADRDIIKNRIDVYNSQTLPVAGFYKEQNKFASIKGEGSLDEIFARICAVLDEIV